MRDLSRLWRERVADDGVVALASSSRRVTVGWIDFAELRPPDARVQGTSQRNVTRVAGQYGSHLAGDVPIADSGVRVGESERASRSGRSERRFASEGPGRTGLHETEREANVAL